MARHCRPPAGQGGYPTRQLHSERPPGVPLVQGLSPLDRRPRVMSSNGCNKGQTTTSAEQKGKDMKLTSVDDVLAGGSGERKLAVADGTHSRVTLWRLEPGQEIRPHVHSGDHVWVVQQGRGWLLTDSEEIGVGVGSLAIVPEGEPHGMRAETLMVFVSVSAG